MLSFAALLTALMLTLSACAEVVKPSADFYYLDDANVLSEATEGEIFFANERLQEACGAEIVVVTVPTTGRMNIEDYAYTLFNDWNIGGESYRGYLLLMAIDDDDYYALPGTYLSSYFDSATIQELNDVYLEPNFAARDYDGGAKRYFEAVFNRICDVLNLNLTVEMGIADYNAFVLENQSQASTSSASFSGESRPESRNGFSIGSLILIVLLVILLVQAVRRFHRRPGGGYSAPPPSGGSGSFATGYFFGRMFRPRFPRRPPPPPPPGPGGFWGPTPGPHGPRRPEPPRNTGSFGGASRGPSPRPGSFGGASRGSSPRPGSFGGASRGSSPRMGGFGGASRSGGASRGPSTRGGGAGRGRR